MDKKELFKFCLRLGDSCLIMAHRQSELCSKGPYLEEDIAQTNLGLDALGQAESLLIYAAELEGTGRTADDLVYKRPERKFYNLLLTEQPNTDFAFVIVRQYFMSVYLSKVYEKLSMVDDEVLSGIALKAIKELKYHVRHFAMWVQRLGDGTKESHERIQTAVNELWVFVAELFEEDENDKIMVTLGYKHPAEELKTYWMNNVKTDLEKATLTVPDSPYGVTGSKKGIHTEYLGFILAEMQYLQRAYPDAKW
jgi:ring-1,2-phenylacetyl-CoA epoxidase subunit PaaC